MRKRSIMLWTVDHIHLIIQRIMTFQTQRRESKTMEFLIPVGVLVLWFILQAWVLPRFGVTT